MKWFDSLEDDIPKFNSLEKTPFEKQRIIDEIRATEEKWARKEAKRRKKFKKKYGIDLDIIEGPIRF